MSADIRKILTRRAVLSGGAAALGSAVLAEAPLTALRPVARAGGAIAPAVEITTGGPSRPEDRIVARPSLETLIARSRAGGDTGVAVADLETGDIIAGHNADLAMMPASVTKAVTAIYALETLGAAHRFHTNLVSDGTVDDDGVLDGDVTLIGGHDPVLDTDDLAVMVEVLASAGVTKVAGAFRVWGGASEVSEIDPTQLPQLGYNPGVSALNLNFNRVHFSWERSGDGYNLFMQGRSARSRPDVRVATMELSDRAGPVFQYTPGSGTDRWSVSRRALGRDGARWLPVRIPALYAGDVFAQLARARGIEITNPELTTDIPGGEVFVEHISPRLDEIVRDMLNYSTNLTAEVIGRAATLAQGGAVDTLQGSATAMNAWLAARFGTQVQFVDHSGLSDTSRVTAGDMVRILTAAQRGPLRPLLKPIPLVNDARERLTDPPGSVAAKTGTLNFVSALAGYYTLDDGRDLAFAIFNNDALARERSKLTPEERPAGSQTYNTRARGLQQRILRFLGRGRADGIEPSQQ